MTWAFGTAVAVWLVLTPLLGSVTVIRENSQIVASLVAVLGVNVATGYGGMISLGHGVFVAMGAFGTAYFADTLGLPWAVALLAGAAIAGASGAVVGLPALRIRGIHLALVTLGLAIVFQPLAKRFPAFTGGVSGRNVQAEVVAPSWWPQQGRLGNATFRYYLCVALVAAAVFTVWWIMRRRPGRTIKAVRDDPTAAAVFGINLTGVRVATFALSASLAGLGGGLGVALVPYISQEPFTPQESLVLYATAVIGGLGIVWGSVVGVAVRESVGWLGDAIDLGAREGFVGELARLASDQAIVFGVGLVLLTFAFPRGVAGVVTEWLGTRPRAARTR